MKKEKKVKMKMKTEQEELQERLDVCLNYLDMFESTLTAKQLEDIESDIDTLQVQLREMRE